MEMIERATPLKDGKIPELANLEVCDRARFKTFLEYAANAGYWFYQGGHHVALMYQKSDGKSVTLARILET